MNILTVATVMTPTQTPLQAERYAWAMLRDALSGWHGKAMTGLLFTTWLYYVRPFTPKTSFGEGLTFIASWDVE